MSAEELGRRLLGEVDMGGLDEILRSLRALRNSGPSKHFGIPELDRLLPVTEQTILPLPQTPAEIWSSSPPRPAQLTSLKPAARDPVVEFISSGPGSGKTHLLYYIASLAVLPSSYANININGKQSAIVVLDADGRFDASRLAEVMTQYIKAKLDLSSLHKPIDATPTKVTQDQNAIRGLIHSSLAHVHIFRPQSHSALLATISNLPFYLSDSTAHQSTHRPLHSIILDSASAFYWQVRAESDSPTANDRYAALTRQLALVARRFSCALLATSHSLASTSVTSTDRGTHVLRSSLPPSWAAFPTLRLAVRRVPVAPFAAALSAEELEREREQRASIVALGRFECWNVGAVGDDGFVFRIGKSGVSIEGD
ncbi:hypothetical protein K432DRAFT_249079, partial [Lepidopterella palustris CBS 459.81]